MWIKYIVDQRRSVFAQLNMLWTSTGPILLIKYIVDQRRSDFAYNIGDWVVYPKVVPSSFRFKTGAPKCPIVDLFQNQSKKLVFA